MERVAFLLEETGVRLGCMLNPETVELRRLAGVRRRRSLQGPVTRPGMADDALLYTGGGTTELHLDLLFDVTVAGSSIETDNVRDLTRPLWQLAENASAGRPYARPPLVHFFWGMAWNIPGIVTAVAERLEYFTRGGAPRRSWLRLRMLRVAEPGLDTESPPPEVPLPERVMATAGPAEGMGVHEIRGGGPDPGTGGERLDQIAHAIYGHSAFWRLLAGFNGVDDPLRLAAGQLLRLPPRSGPGATW
jgi:hypothetical protein